MISLPTIPAWVENAACASSDPELWQIKKDRPTRAERKTVEYAKAICADCPVRLLCLEDAIERGEQHGIWGGLTPAERHTMTAGHVERPDHGDLAGYKRHISQGTPTCEPCRAANAAYQREKRARNGRAPRPRKTPVRRLAPISHGTHSGYVQHTRRKEAVCQRCLDAEAQYGRERRARAKQVAS